MKNHSLFPDLGTGVGLRPAYYDQFLKQKPSPVSWVEVISENYMGWNSDPFPSPEKRPLQILERIRRDFPVALHGVSLNLGSTDSLDHEYLRRLKELADRIQPAWISDHLCWTKVDGQNLHDLLPLPFAGEALELIVANIDRVQDFLGRRILVENVSSYVQFEQSEMSEWNFLAEVARRADCALLLDINNIYVNSVNHGFDPMTYLSALPRDRIAQFHLAGHTDRGSHLIDTHDEPVCDEVWALYRQAIRHFGPVSAMIERDANFPPWEELEKELQCIERIRHEETGPPETARVPAVL